MNVLRWGSWKSYMSNKLKGKYKIIATASTGISAVNIDGITIDKKLELCKSNKYFRDSVELAEKLMNNKTAVLSDEEEIQPPRYISKRSCELVCNKNPKEITVMANIKKVLFVMVGKI